MFVVVLLIAAFAAAESADSTPMQDQVAFQRQSGSGQAQRDNVTRSQKQPAIERQSGSGRLVIPVSAGGTVVRVAINSAIDTPGAWFWCVDSDRGLTYDRRYCAADGVRDPATGDITVVAVLQLEPGDVAGATFFVQTYCQAACSWQASAEAVSSENTAAR